MRAAERGQGLTEYVVFLSAAALVVIAALRDDMGWRTKFISAMQSNEQKLKDCFPNVRPPSVASENPNPNCGSSENHFVLDSENFDDGELAP